MKPNFEEILKKLIEKNSSESYITRMEDKEIILAAMQEVWNIAIDQAAENAKLKFLFSVY